MASVLKLTKEEQELKNERYREWKSKINDLIVCTDNAHKNGNELSINSAQKAYHILAQHVRTGEVVPEFLKDKLIIAQQKYNQLMTSKGFPEEYRLIKRYKQSISKAKIIRFTLIAVTFVVLISAVALYVSNKTNTNKEFTELTAKQLDVDYDNVKSFNITDVEYNKLSGGFGGKNIELAKTTGYITFTGFNKNNEGFGSNEEKTERFNVYLILINGKWVHDAGHAGW